MSHPPHGPSSDIKRTFSSDVEDHPSPPASHPEIQHSTRHANHHKTDPDANKPSTAAAPVTHREETRRYMLKKIGSAAAAGGAGGGIVGGVPGAVTGFGVGTLCGAISGAVESSSWDGAGITPSLGHCILYGFQPFTV